MRPAAVITSYILYAYSGDLQLLARHAFNAFALLQVQFVCVVAVVFVRAAEGVSVSTISCLVELCLFLSLPHPLCWAHRSTVP